MITPTTVSFSAWPSPLMASIQPFMSGAHGGGDFKGDLSFGEGTNSGTDKPRALVVDDAPDVTELLSTLMRFAGYEAVMAFSATEALDAARQQRFDVVISDIGMPGMNGYDLARMLRALPAYTSVPLIAVSGFSMYDNRAKAIEAGFNDFLTKPISPADLIDRVKRLRE